MAIGCFQIAPTLRPEDLLVDVDAKRLTRTSAATTPDAKAKEVHFDEPQLRRSAREARQDRRHAKLRNFLHKYGFSDVNRPVMLLGGKDEPHDEVFPVHVAAHLGELVMLRYLVAAGADLQRKSGRGFSAQDFAESNLSGLRHQM
ncbi:unnamed protein product, partial [Cladocopium goreaui]